MPTACCWLLLVFLISPWLPATAQPRWHVGALLSANAGSVRYQPELFHNGAPAPAARAGFAAGLGAWHALAPHWALQPSMRYVRSGFTLDETVMTGSQQYLSFSYYHATLTRHQLDLPVQVNYYFTRAGRGVYVAAGVAGSVLLAGRYTYDNLFTDHGLHPDEHIAGTQAVLIGAVYPAPPYYDGRYSLRRWDLSLLEGLGYQSQQFQAQLSARLGVLNTATAPSFQLPSPTSYTYSVEAQVGYFLTGQQARQEHPR